MLFYNYQMPRSINLISKDGILTQFVQIGIFDQLHSDLTQSASVLHDIGNSVQNSESRLGIYNPGDNLFRKISNDLNNHATLITQEVNSNHVA